MRASGARSRSRNAAVPSERATMASMVSSRRSARSWSAMATLALSQVLQRAELELLDCAFRALESGRHLANALLFDEAHPDHLPLEIGQPFDVLIQRDAALDVLELTRIGHVRSRLVRLAAALPPVVRERVRRDTEQPGRHREPAPLELTDGGERPLEYLGRDVLSGGAIFCATTDEGVDPIDVPFVNVDKSSGIGLRRFDQKPVVFSGLVQSEPRVSILV